MDNEKIEILQNGEKYVAYYKVEGKYLTVYGYLSDSKTTNIEGLDHNKIEGMANVLLSELINEGKIKPVDN